MKTIKYLQMSAIILTASLTGLDAAEQARPFRGTIQVVETWDIQFPALFVEGIGSGHATLLGNFTCTYEAEVNLLTAAGSGFTQFVAANGDSLFTESVGQASPTGNPEVSFIVENCIITGGTGRFTGATGNFTVKRWLNTVTGLTSGSFSGTIVVH